MKSKWVVRLGQADWQRHTQFPSVGESLRILGSVQRGAQIGALAVDGNGDFFQINGEYVAPLYKRLIAKAVKAAQRCMPFRYDSPRPRRVAAPVVTVRRRRLAGSLLPPNPAPAAD